MKVRSLVQRNREAQSVKRDTESGRIIKMNLQTELTIRKMVRYHERTGKIILELVSQHKIPREALKDEKTRRDLSTPSRKGESTPQERLPRF